MKNRKHKEDTSNQQLRPIKKMQWEKLPIDHFGYANDTQRRAKRGLEEWEMVNDHSSESDNEFNNSHWMRITLVVSTIATLLLYFYGVEITPPHTLEWFEGVYREEIFLAIFFCILLYTSMLLKLILESPDRGSVNPSPSGDGMI